MIAKGLLLVFAEVGDEVSESEFHDWYDNEHIPLRTALEGFKSAARLVQTDDQKPTWGAIYDVSEADYLYAPAYALLAEARSARELDVLSKLELLERRIYALDDFIPVAVTDTYDGLNEGTTLVCISLDVAPEAEAEFHKWYNEEHIPLLRKVPSWLRTRCYVLLDRTINSKGGTSNPPKFLLIHEYARTEGLPGPEWEEATSTPWRQKIYENVKAKERRVMKVFKKFL